MPAYSDLFLQFFGGLLAVPAIVAIVNLIKKIKDIGAYNALVALALGIGSQLWVVFTYGNIDKISINAAIGVGVIIGLAASGLYDITKKA